MSPKSSPEIKPQSDNFNKNSNDDSLKLEDFSDVKKNLIQKGESYRWKRVVSMFVFILIAALVISICVIFPLRIETTPKTSFQKSKFYEHSEWFSLSYPNGAPPV